MTTFEKHETFRIDDIFTMLVHNITYIKMRKQHKLML